MESKLFLPELEFSSTSSRSKLIWLHNLVRNQFELYYLLISIFLKYSVLSFCVSYDIFREVAVYVGLFSNIAFPLRITFRMRPTTNLSSFTHTRYEMDVF